MVLGVIARRDVKLESRITLCFPTTHTIINNTSTNTDRAIFWFSDRFELDEKDNDFLLLKGDTGFVCRQNMQAKLFLTEKLLEMLYLTKRLLKR